MNRYKLILRAAFFIWLNYGLVACQEQSEVPVPPKEKPAEEVKGGKISKLEKDGETYAYTYNAQGLLTKTLLTGGLSQVEMLYDYDQNQNLTQVRVYNEVSNKFYYTANKLSKSEEYNSQKVIATTFYEFNNQQQLTAATILFSLPNTPHPATITAHKTTYSYNSAGNLTLASEYLKTAGNDNYVLSATTKYTQFDTHPSIMDVIVEDRLLPIPVKRFKNNAGLVVYTQGTYQRQVKLTYQYNDQGLPISRTSQLTENNQIHTPEETKIIYLE